MLAWERTKPPEAADGNRSCGCRSRLSGVASVGSQHWCHSAVAVICLALELSLERKSCMGGKAVRNCQQYLGVQPMQARGGYEVTISKPESTWA